VLSLGIGDEESIAAFQEELQEQLNLCLAG
jgi:hypothetical protein